MRHLVLLALVSTIVSACASRAASVPVLATTADAGPLVGKWAGEYSSPVTGRSGSIVFTLASAGDSARGDVVMTPRGSNQPYRPADRSRGDTSVETTPDNQVLTISFVRVAGPVVSGTLAPYRDAECGCVLVTTFSGTLGDDVIEGTFTTRGLPGGSEPTGRWRVKRTR
ncbi:MAG TPA: hypothetical protein VJ812_05900 [Gemmatimonadaceae bacterium]|jgi:hypothetical protein|nr:hypothetical protein [Gemmatimonadaceae bacterium]